MAKHLARIAPCLLLAAALATSAAGAGPDAFDDAGAEPALLPPGDVSPLKWGPRAPVARDAGDYANGSADGPRWQPPRTSTPPRRRGSRSPAAPSESRDDGRAGDQRARRASAQAAAAAPDAEAVLGQAYQRSTTANGEAGYTETIELCQDALEAGLPTKEATYGRRLLAWGYNKRGEARSAAGHADAALDDFEAAVDADKTCWRALHNRGVSYAALGRTSEAIDDFGRTIELSRDFGAAYFNRGETRCELGDFASALDDYAMAARLMPEDAPTFNSRGYAHYRLRQMAEALADFNQALELDSENAAAHVNRGDVYAETGAYAEAAADYKAAIKLDRHSGRAFQSVAWLMATCPDDEYRDGRLAVKAAERAIKLDGRDDYRYLATLAAACASQGDFEQAQQAQQEALRLAPEDAQAVEQRRLALYQSQKPYLTPRRPAIAERPPADTVRE